MLRLRTAKISNTLYKAQCKLGEAKEARKYNTRTWQRIDLSEAQQEVFLHDALKYLRQAADDLEVELDRIAEEDGR